MCSRETETDEVTVASVLLGKNIGWVLQAKDVRLGWSGDQGHMQAEIHSSNVYGTRSGTQKYYAVDNWLSDDCIKISKYKPCKVVALRDRGLHAHILHGVT